MGQKLEVIKYFPRAAYGNSDNDTPVKLIGDGPKNAKGEITSTIIRISPTPFGSPNKKDLHDQYFKSGIPVPDGEGTYFGDNFITTKMGLYEHGMNDINNAEMHKFGKLSNILGPAHLVKIEGDPTRWFDIEVQRALQYHDWLLDLVDLKVMGASTQAFMNNVVVADDGGIDVWVENEVGPTVSPANPDTIKQMASLLKSPKYISLPPMAVKTFNQKKELVEVLVDEDSVSEETTSLVAEIEQIFAEEVVEDVTAVAEAIAEAAPSLTPEQVENLGKALTAQVNAAVAAQMSSFIELWGNSPQEAKNAINSMMDSAKDAADAKKMLTEVKGELGDISKAFLVFAKMLKDTRMSQAAKEFNSMSQLEREILEQQEREKQDSQQRKQYRGVAPQGAPGTN